MNGSCHCGRVTIALPARPEYLNRCNCTVCTKLGTLWGYYTATEVGIAGETRAYRRADVETPLLDFNFCAVCGVTTHWSPTEHFDSPRLAVNMRLFEPAELAGVEVRYGDKRNTGIGEPRRYWRAPTVFGEAGL